jgi:D-alanyl-D-alanine carboxypeptidase
MNVETAAAALVEGGCPGAVVAVRSDVLEIAAAGLASVERAERMTPAHRFRIGSTTKTYVATLALILAAEGLLDLDEPGVLPAEPRLTLRMLLSHQSGLANYMAGEAIAAARAADPLRGADPQADVEQALAMPRLFEPGEDVSYSDTNYQAVGVIVQEAGGAPLAELVQTRLLEPLGLDRTTFAVEGRVEDGLSSGYAEPDGWYPMAGEVTAHLDGAHGDGAIVSDANDVTAFLAALLGGRLLPEDALAQMRTGRTNEQGAIVGLGLFGVPWESDRWWGHGGDMPGHDIILRATSDGGVVVTAMVNVQGAATAATLVGVADELCATRLSRTRAGRR